jgi:hypothetical protein
MAFPSVMTLPPRRCALYFLPWRATFTLIRQPQLLKRRNPVLIDDPVESGTREMQFVAPVALILGSGCERSASVDHVDPVLWRQS